MKRKKEIIKRVNGERRIQYKTREKREMEMIKDINEGNINTRKRNTEK